MIDGDLVFILAVFVHMIHTCRISQAYSQEKHPTSPTLIKKLPPSQPLTSHCHCVAIVTCGTALPSLPTPR